MLSPLPLGVGRLDSPIMPSPGTARNLAVDSRLNSQEGLSSSAMTSENSDKSSTDIDKAIEANKELSLAYQIMKAITRLEKGAKDNNSVRENSEDFTVDLKYSTSQIQLEHQNFSSGINTVANISVFRESFDLSISLVSSEETGSFRFDFSLAVTSSRFSLTTQQEETKQVDPLILNLDGNDFSFDLSYETDFDLDADGLLDRFHSLSSGNYFLALDKNANGVIDNGLELFGDAGGAVDGFAALSEYDSNNDRTINAEDEVYQRLMLLSFGSGGVQRLRSIADEGIADISLKAIESARTYEDQNKLISESGFSKTDGSTGRVGDFLITAR